MGFFSLVRAVVQKALPQPNPAANRRTQDLHTFAFEGFALPLGDGTAFSPVLQAAGRWMEMPEPNQPASILYEGDSGQYVMVQHVMGSNPQARKASDLEAASFLRMHGVEFPVRLQRFTDPAEWLKSDRLPRPMAHWAEHHPITIDTEKLAHAVKASDLAIEIVRAGTEFVQVMCKAGKALDLGRERLREVRYAIAIALFSHYCVEAGSWWGSKDRLPPAAVGLLELQWPDGTKELQQTIHRLQQLLEPPLACLNWSERRVDNPRAPTHEETLLAETTLDGAVPEVERLVVHIRAELNRLNSGEVVAQLREDGTVPLPSEEALQVYQIWYVTRATQVAIAKMMTRATGKPMGQGMVSKRLNEVNKWLAVGNQLPPANLDAIRRAINLDPSVLDLGARQDGRSSRQRPVADEE